MLSSSNNSCGAENDGAVAEEETAREMIGKLTRFKGNDVCADCGDSNPQWASINFGVFICIRCAGIHRSLTGISVSKVRSVQLDTWTEDMIKTLASTGNQKARDHYEAKVPACWLPPKPDSHPICHEQWIKAKYERKEFVPEIEELKLSYTTGKKQGYLTKRKKDADEWKDRWFVLSKDFFSYYLVYQDKNPKASIPLSHLNATLQVPGLEERGNTMLIAFYNPKLRKTRNLFVYAESGKVIMDWFCAIRMAKIKLLQEVFLDRPLKIIAQKASRDFVHFGYLEKMPPSQTKWQRRFFVLDHNSLRYYNQPTDPHANGEIIIGSSVDGYSVDLKMPVRLLNCNHGFMLRVPNRSRGGFPLQADTAASKEKWMESLRKVIAESTGSPDQSVAPSSYDEDEEFCASFDERMI